MLGNYGIKQTDYRLSPEFNKYGCNVRSLLRLVEEESDYLFSPREIMDIVTNAMSEGYVTSDMRVKSYVGLSREAYKVLGNKTSYISDIGTVREGEAPVFYGFAEKKGWREWDYIIARWKTINSGIHYVAENAAETILFDSYPEDVLAEKDYSILMKVFD